MKWTAIVGAVALAGVAAGIAILRRKPKKSNVVEAPCDGYLSRQDTTAVIKHNTLMNGITSTRGQAMGFIQINKLTLDDGEFTLVKQLMSTKTNLMMKDPVRVSYTFHGTYTRNGNSVQLSKAISGEGNVDWGTFSKFLDTGNGIYDSETSPGILSLYPTDFFVENCKNVPMTVYLNDEDKTFVFEAFEPVILSAEEAGSVQVQKQELDPNAGLMRNPLTGDMSGYVLKEAYAGWGMKVGTCINPQYLEEPYVSKLKEQFSSITLENHLKPGATLSQALSKENGMVSVKFSPETVMLLNWCKENNMPLRGHTLIWYMGTPEWLFHEGFETDAPNVSREVMLQRMEDYIRAFFETLEAGGWSETMYCIDVVNEAIIAPGTLRKCMWWDVIGEDYVWCAFHYARKYVPAHIKLCYNDFDLEMKVDKVIELVNSLKDTDGNPLVDMIGQQGHYGAYSGIDTLMAAMRKIGVETGCELQVTELDVSISRQGTEDELKRQGRFYYNFVQQVLALREEGVNISGLTLWGFADQLSWMPSGYLHIYDRNMVPKYAFFGMLGVKAYAGFGGGEEISDGTAHKEMHFIVPGDPNRFVQLKPDGSFLDTTTGTEIAGTYVFDGVSTYMLTPKAGGYSNLTVSDDECTAVRMEAAGDKQDLQRA